MIPVHIVTTRPPYFLYRYDHQTLAYSQEISDNGKLHHHILVAFEDFHEATNLRRSYWREADTDCPVPHGTRTYCSVCGNYCKIKFIQSEEHLFNTKQYIDRKNGLFQSQQEEGAA